VGHSKNENTNYAPRTTLSAQEIFYTNLFSKEANMGQRLAGKVAIITGAARGIGATSAQFFAQEGAAVALWDTNESRGQALADNISAHEGRAIFCRCDVTAAAEIEAALARVVTELGLPTVLFNNAGIAVVGGVEEISEAEWDRQFAVNVKSIYLVSGRVIPYMRQAGGGSIINMGSESAFVGFPMHPAYCASKAAVVHLTRSMAVRYAPEGIRVNSLCPGTIETELYQEFLSKQPDPEAVNAEIKRLHPLGLGQPEDIAWAAVYMASDESRYMTGTPLMVDGGMTAM
jgi:NAD(P)-dependent dehydrogenase (short-subunit alcohol dehydrogenase family)